MFGIMLYDILFFGIPTVLLALFGVCVYRYVMAKRANKACPGTYPAEELKRRKVMLIVISVVAGVLAVVVIGFIALLFMAVAFM